MLEVWNFLNYKGTVKHFSNQYVYGVFVNSENAYWEKDHFEELSRLPAA